MQSSQNLRDIFRLHGETLTALSDKGFPFAILLPDMKMFDVARDMMRGNADIDRAKAALRGTVLPRDRASGTWPVYYNLSAPRRSKAGAIGTNNQTLCAGFLFALYNLGYHDAVLFETSTSGHCISSHTIRDNMLEKSGRPHAIL